METLSHLDKGIKVHTFIELHTENGMQPVLINTSKGTGLFCRICGEVLQFEISEVKNETKS
jgi:hypothetical protein